MSLFIPVHRKRTCSFEVSVFNAANVLVPFSGDVMRVKVTRSGDQGTPLLDLDSIEASENGSTVSAANPTTVRLDQDDLDIPPGAYDLEVGIVDDADSNAFKHAESGILFVNASPGGDIGAT